LGWVWRLQCWWSSRPRPPQRSAMRVNHDCDRDS
jgi:hypothetical protein